MNWTSYGSSMCYCRSETRVLPESFTPSVAKRAPPRWRKFEFGALFVAIDWEGARRCRPLKGTPRFSGGISSHLHAGLVAGVALRLRCALFFVALRLRLCDFVFCAWWLCGFAFCVLRFALLRCCVSQLCALCFASIDRRARAAHRSVRATLNRQYFQLVTSAPFGAVCSMCRTISGRKRWGNVAPAGPDESPAPE